jgi:hypothetical protein
VRRGSRCANSGGCSTPSTGNTLQPDSSPTPASTAAVLSPRVGAMPASARVVAGWRLIGPRTDAPPLQDSRRPVDEAGPPGRPSCRPSALARAGREGLTKTARTAVLLPTHAWNVRYIGVVDPSTMRSGPRSMRFGVAAAAADFEISGLVRATVGHRDQMMSFEVLSRAADLAAITVAAQHSLAQRRGPRAMPASRGRRLARVGRAAYPAAILALQITQKLPLTASPGPCSARAAARWPPRRPS